MVAPTLTNTQSSMNSIPTPRRMVKTASSPTNVAERNNNGRNGIATRMPASLGRWIKYVRAERYIRIPRSVDASVRIRNNGASTETQRIGAQLFTRATQNQAIATNETIVSSIGQSRTSPRSADRSVENRKNAGNFRLAPPWSTRCRATTGRPGRADPPTRDRSRLRDLPSE